jgi:hypothetical protein
MKNQQIKIVTGSSSGHDNYSIIEWNCPFTGEAVQSEGEHYYEEELQAYVHDVYYEDSLEIAYTVIAK